jgi:hypothetical protein
MKKSGTSSRPAAGKSRPEDVLRQTADLIEQTASFNVQMSRDGASFYTKPARRQGIQAVKGSIYDENYLELKFKLIETAKNSRIPAELLFAELAKLGDRTPVGTSETEEDTETGNTSLWVKLKVQAVPLSISRSSNLLSQLQTIEKVAKILQVEVPTIKENKDLLKLYKNVRDRIEPVFPYEEKQGPLSVLFKSWALEILDFLNGSLSVALAHTSAVQLNYALARLAHAAGLQGSSIGRCTLPAIGAKGLIDLVARAPGFTAVPATRINMGTNIYEMSNEIQGMLTVMTENGKPALFSGAYSELQSVFHGGQGGVGDPLLPVVSHIPSIPLGALIRFAVETDSRSAASLTKTEKAMMIAELGDHLQDLHSADQHRLLPAVVNRAITLSTKAGNRNQSDIKDYITRLSNVSETLAGLSHKPRSVRLPRVEQRYTQVFIDPDFAGFLKDYLVGQDKTLDRLAKRLRSEALMRSGHQPIRYLAQGTPATGKSESAQLIADRLEIPFINIDASSFSDKYSASAQLFGSARGIVGSYESGRLEQAAKHHIGAVVEISDLDHCESAVRMQLADLFLRILDLGEAQSTKGPIFSCANLIFAFTINLPRGLDEEVHRSFGFSNQPDICQVRRKVIGHLRQMFSGAFLSRVGFPIIFDPLAGDALGSIVEGAIRSGLQRACQRLQLDVESVVIDKNVGEKMLPHLSSNITSFGARSLIETVQGEAAEALIRLVDNTVRFDKSKLLVMADKKAGLEIKVVYAVKRGGEHG